MKIIEIPIDKVIVKDRYRDDLGDLSGLIATIKEHGLLQPVIVNQRNELKAGGRRLAAAKEAGLKKVEAIVRKTDGELDELEIELIENKFRKDMTWVEQAKLEKRIFEIRSKVDPKWSQRRQAEYLDQAPGTTDRRMVLAQAIEVIPELADEVNENQAWKKYKELEHRAAIAAYSKKISKGAESAAKYAADHFQIGDVLKEIKAVSGDTCQFAEVDPPYAIELVDRKQKSKHSKQLTDRYTELEAGGYIAWIKELAEEVYRILAPHSYCVWWFGIEWYKEVRTVLEDTGFGVTVVPGIWDKEIPGQTSSPDTTLGSSYETFFVCRKGSAKLQKAGRSNVFRFKPVPPGSKIHPTEKPIELYLEIIDTFVFPGSRVICPVLGSGNLLRALYMRKMVGYGWELDQELKKNFIARVKEDKMREEEAEAAAK